MMSSIPITEAVSVFNTIEDSKDRILFTLQIAVKQIQHCSSIQGIENSLSFDAHEVRQLCDSLDKALLHGLKCCQKGYWPFVKEFTHSNTVKYLEELGKAHTELQYGRYWLCLALTESSMESYFRSFLENMQLVKKHYESLAILRDAQKMHLILMLMAGLEYVQINLDVDNIDCGSGISVFGACAAFEGSSGSFMELKEYFSIRKSSQSSHSAIDFDVIPCDNAVEVTSDFSEKPPFSAAQRKQSGNQVNLVKPKSLDVDLSNKVSNQDLERITYFINIDTEGDLGADKQLEVVRTKVVKRTKKSFCQKSFSDDKISEAQHRSSPSPESKTQSLNEANECAENRLSKATTDSGLCLETPCSSDNESPDFNCDHAETLSGKQTFFEVGDFQRDITVTFSTPIKKNQERSNGASSDSSSETHLEERGSPEGQEDPSGIICNSNGASDRQPLNSGSDGCEDEEEISIYDLNKMPYFTECEALSPINKTLNYESSDSVEIDSTNQSNDDSEMVSYVNEDFDLLVMNRPEDVDLRVGNNVLLYFLVEVYEYEEEAFHKYLYYIEMHRWLVLYGWLSIKILQKKWGVENASGLYLVYSSFPEGMCQRVYFLLTNKCIYILKQGNDQQKFFKCHAIRYTNIDYLIVNLNYQGFRIVNTTKEHFSLHTAEDELTRTIISNLELAIRRFVPKVFLPAVFTDALTQTLALKKFISSQLKCEKSDVVLQHYALVRWQDSNTNSITPSGPVCQDFLMYRHKFAKENKSTPWQPAYFLLKGGVLYCMEEEKSKPIFFIQMWAPHCKGCRRIHLLNRPHTFEIIRSDSDSLQLAAADECEASNWLHCFLQTVSLAGHFIDTEQDVHHPCSVLLSNDNLILATDEPSSNQLQCLAKSNLRDLVCTFVDEVATNFVMMEFEVAEAAKSTGDWIFFFESQQEKENFLDCVCSRWCALFQLDLHTENIKDLYLRKKYRHIVEELNQEQMAFHEFCKDT